MAARPNLLVSPFSRAEYANAIYQQVYRRRINEIDAKRAWENFESDCRSGLMQRAVFPEAAWNRTVDLAHRFTPVLGVRTLDSLHVACALELRAEKFWTFDERQTRLAEMVGLDTTA